MKIYNGNGTVLLDVIITQDAVHEEELMKSDFVRLSWNDMEYNRLPVDSYIQPYNDVIDFLTGEPIKYSLYEPYEPEQSSEAGWKYTPQFQHPKMYLSKVPFTRPGADSLHNAINILDWSYTGFVGTLLGYFIEKINDTFGLTGDNGFSCVLVGTIDNTVTISFQTVDVLSGLSNLANNLKCEWHLDWEQELLYFGHISYDKNGLTVPVLKVGENVGVPSIRNSKEGYWNAFEPQGSTRNITRRAASGEFVQASVRLSLRNYPVYQTDENGAFVLDARGRKILTGYKYTDGTIYSLGEFEMDDEGQKVIKTYNKEEFDAIGEKKYAKTIIFEEIYPHVDLYAYDIRYRERYLLEDEDDPDSKVISYYDSQNKPVYKRYAIWYMKLAIPTNVEKTEFSQYRLRYEVFSKVTRVVSKDSTIITIITDMPFSDAIFANLVESITDEETGDVLNIYRVTVTIGDKTFLSNASVAGGDGSDKNNVRLQTTRELSGLSNEDFASLSDSIVVGSEITFVDGCNITKVPQSNRISQVVDGKSLYCQFKVNTEEGAVSSSLAGRGDGDNGNYGFELAALGYDDEHNEEYIKEVNNVKRGDDDTGIIYPDGTQGRAEAGDYEIILQQSGDYILPTTKDIDGISDSGLIPREKTKNTPSKLNNIVNLYNIVMDESYEESAKKELEEETKKYIKNQYIDDNSYTVKSNPIAFEQSNPGLYIGRKVYYVDNNIYKDVDENGEPYSSDEIEKHVLVTRVMKIVTHLDYGFEQEITVGNEVLKGTQQQLKEDVQTLISAGAGTGSGGVSTSAIQNIVKNWVTPRFLSKMKDDTAAGTVDFQQNITVRNDVAIGGNTDVVGTLEVGGDTTIDGILTAFVKMLTNRIESDNFTGDWQDAFGSGFQMKKDSADGVTSLVVDNLFVRMKAIFTELEIRKISYAGGNIIFSHAGSKVVRVEEVKENGVLTAYRCYLLKDDGSTATENWWRVGDQARCQTFNVVEPGNYTNAQNTYYWRLVVATGTEELEDGKNYDYVDLSATDYDTATNNDVPQAGDQLVQMGNRGLDSDGIGRQGFVTIEVYGENAPAFKVYKGVSGYSLLNKRKVCLSPQHSDLKVQSLTIETEYDAQRVPMERGNWLDLSTDENGRRRCYYYDLLQHIGATWLCIVPEGTFTTDEPSVSSPAWRIYAQKGADAVPTAPNLLLDTAEYKKPSLWFQLHGENSDGYMGRVARHVNPQGTSDPAGDAYQRIAEQQISGNGMTLLEPETWYTLSGFFKGSGGAFIGLLQCGGYIEELHYGDGNEQTGTLTPTSDVYCVFSLTSEWTRHTLTFRTKATMSDTYGMYASTRLLDLTGNASVCMLKLEIGNKATAYLPNEQDLAGEDAMNVIVTPAALIVNQSLQNINNLSDLSSDPSARAILQIMRGGEVQQVTGISITSRHQCNATAGTASGNGYIQMMAVSTYTQGGKTIFYDSGYVICSLTYAGGTIDNVKVPFYANLLGTWKETVEGDTKEAIAQSNLFDIDENGNIVESQYLGNYIQSSTQNIATLQSVVGNSENGLVRSVSDLRQETDSIAFSVENVKKENVNFTDKSVWELGMIDKDGDWSTSDDWDYIKTFVYSANGALHTKNVYPVSLIEDKNIALNGGYEVRLWFFSDEGTDAEYTEWLVPEQNVLECTRYHASPQDAHHFRVPTFATFFAMEITSDSSGDQSHAVSDISTIRPSVQSALMASQGFANIAADNVRIGVKQGLVATGIDIDNNKIDLIADDVTIKNNKGEDILSTDKSGTTTLKDVKIEGSLMSHKVGSRKFTRSENEIWNLFEVVTDEEDEFERFLLPYDRIIVYGQKGAYNISLNLPPAGYFIGTEIGVTLPIKTEGGVDLYVCDYDPVNGYKQITGNTDYNFFAEPYIGSGQHLDYTYMSSFQIVVQDALQQAGYRSVTLVAIEDITARKDSSGKNACWILTQCGKI